MITKNIIDPMPIWNLIKRSMLDDYEDMDLSWQFFGVFDGDRMAGAFGVKQWNSHCFEVNGGIHPEFFGRGVEICDHFGRSIFANTPCLKIVAIVPEYNHLMRRCLEKVGLIKEGVISKSILKWSRLHDQIVYGIRKSDVKIERRIVWQQ